MIGLVPYLEDPTDNIWIRNPEGGNHLDFFERLVRILNPVEVKIIYLGGFKKIYRITNQDFAFSKAREYIEMSIGVFGIRLDCESRWIHSGS
jgi:hypothetical protein